MSDETPQRATEPVVTSFFSRPAEPAPWSELDTLIVEGTTRLRGLLTAGSWPDGEECQAATTEFGRPFQAAVTPLQQHCRRLAWDYLRKLGISGAPDRSDVPRLVELLERECGLQIAGSRFLRGLYFGADPDAQARGVILPYYPTDDTCALVELIGQFLAPWPRPAYRLLAPEAADIRRLVAHVDLLCGEAFAKAWWDGPQWLYGANDPAALPLLAKWGLDHFPTLEEAQRLADRDPGAPGVRCGEFAQPCLMRVRGVALFLFPRPQPTAEQLAHTAVQMQAAQARALAFRHELGLTGPAQPADVWRLVESQEEAGVIFLRRGDVDRGRVVYWKDRPKSITLPQEPASPEAEAEELLLLLGFALCAGPERGFDYEALEVNDTKDQLTRPVAIAFRDAFRGAGEEEAGDPALRRAAELGREWRERLGFAPDYRPNVFDAWRVVTGSPQLQVQRSGNTPFIQRFGDGSVLLTLPKSFPDPETELVTVLEETGAALLAVEGVLPDTTRAGHGPYGETFAAAFRGGATW